MSNKELLETQQWHTNKFEDKNEYKNEEISVKGNNFKFVPCEIQPLDLYLARFSHYLRFSRDFEPFQSKFFWLVFGFLANAMEYFSQNHMSLL